MDNDSWAELYRQSKRNAPIEPPPPVQSGRAIPPVPEGTPGIAVARRIEFDRDEIEQHGKSIRGAALTFTASLKVRRVSPNLPPRPAVRRSGSDLLGGVGRNQFFENIDRLEN